MKIRKFILAICILILTFTFVTNTNAQDAKKDSISVPDNRPVVHPKPGSSDPSHDLATASANPIANMITLPLQNNFSFGAGEYDRMQWTTNLQPVLPFKLNKNLSFINRVIIPVTYKINNEESGGTWGIGNTNWTMYVVPKVLKVSKGINFTWGMGPVLSIPTATSEALGGDSFGIGPTGVGLFMTKHFVGGIMAGYVFSYKTDDIRTFFAQYFFTWNIKKGWFINSAPTFTGNLNAPDGGSEWNVPLGGGGGKILKFGKQPMKLFVQGFYNVVTPNENASPWSMQFMMIFMFPKKAK